MPPTTRQRRPTWELADLLLPYQGDWSVEDYLKLNTNRLIEFADGFLEFLPMPEEIHWFVQQFIFATVDAFLRARGKGTARYAPFKVRVGERAFREPDVCVLLDENDPRRARKYWGGADLVIEVVSPDGEQRDYVEKRSDYAAAKVAEYWIVDPQKSEFLVLRLVGEHYVEHRRFRLGAVAESVVLEGLRIDVRACFDAAERSASPHDEPPAERG